jgi:hypothetical protein
MSIAFSKPLTCCKGLEGACVRSGGGQILEVWSLATSEVGPVIDKFKRTAKWLGEVLEAIQ